MSAIWGNSENIGSLRVFLPLTQDRGRDAHCWTPPARIRTSPIRASGSYLGCLTAKHVPYAAQRLGHALPALGPVRALLVRVSLGPCPWLHRLHNRQPRLCSAASQLLWQSLTSPNRASVATAPRLPTADRQPSRDCGRSGDLPVP